MVGISSQSDSGCLPGFCRCPYDLIGIVACCIIFAVRGQLQLHILAIGLSIEATINIEGNSDTSLQCLTKVNAEGRPAAACVAQLQGITAAVCRSRDIYIGIRYPFNGGILTGSCYSEQTCIACDLKANTFQEVSFRCDRLDCYEVIHIDLSGSSFRCNSRPVNVPEQIQVVCCFSQSNLNNCPLAAGKFICSHTVILKAALIHSALSEDSAVCHKGDLSTGLQCLTEVNTESGPVEASVAQLQRITSSVIGNRKVRICISNPFNGCITSGFSLSGKQTGISCDLKVNALQEVTFRLNRRNCLEVIHINLKVFRTRLKPTVHIALHINVAAIGSQYEGATLPGTVGILSYRILAA